MARKQMGRGNLESANRQREFRLFRGLLLTLSFIAIMLDKGMNANPFLKNAAMMLTLQNRPF